MEIKMAEKKRCDFKDISVGNCFIYNKHVHLKIYNVPSDEYKQYNAIDLEFNEAVKMSANKEVHPVEASIDVKPMY